MCADFALSFFLRLFSSITFIYFSHLYILHILTTGLKLDVIKTIFILHIKSILPSHNTFTIVFKISELWCLTTHRNIQNRQPCEEEARSIHTISYYTNTPNNLLKQFGELHLTLYLILCFTEYFTAAISPYPSLHLLAIPFRIHTPTEVYTKSMSHTGSINFKQESFINLSQFKCHTPSVSTEGDILQQRGYGLQSE